MSSYPDSRLQIGGVWCDAQDGAVLDVVSPATGTMIGHVAHGGTGDIDRAAAAAASAFTVWSAIPAFERGALLHKAAAILREVAETIGPIMTAEQGKPVAEAVGEVISSADIIDYFAEEGKRIHGRLVAPRTPGVLQSVIKEPVGPVAAFAPWNFPILQAVRKVAAALAAGCTVVLKGPEETPASCAAMVDAFIKAGLPPGALNLLFGTPDQISSQLIADPRIRKISFTGSTSVGKQLASLAGRHMKRVTMELGGHAPAVVFADADLPTAIRVLSQNKFRNAGQICVAPSRFLVEAAVYDRFVEGFTAAARTTMVGDGMDPKTQMGPLANARRVDAMDRLVADAVAKGATVGTGGQRRGNTGFFYEPTVLTEVSTDMAIMNDEPFGPVAPIMPFEGIDAALAESNRLAFGLAAYVYTGSPKTADLLAHRLENGIVSINQHARSVPELPFGGVKDSGYGSEGGVEGLEAYLNTKLVSQAQFMDG